MKGKRKALKALLVFFLVVFACMFCARTVQTIVTPKVRRVAAVKGKLEQTLSFEGEISFSKTENETVRAARKLNVTVDQVVAKPGYFLKKGEPVLTAFAPTLEEEMGKLNEAYLKAATELNKEISSHVRVKNTTVHNDIYNAAQAASEAYYAALLSVRVLAQQEGYTLPSDAADFGTLEGASEKVQASAKACLDQYAAYQTAQKALKTLYLTGENRVGDATFEFVLKCDGYRKEIAANTEKMLALQALADSLSAVCAPHNGYIVSIDVKSGDTLDGAKTAYTLSPEGAYPILKADITNIDKPIVKGAKILAGAKQVVLKVSDITVEAGGKKTMEIQLDEKALSSLGGLTSLLGEKIPLYYDYKAAKSTTLLPASAVRQENEKSYYVYIVSQSNGGLLGGTEYKLTKQTVTVLEKGDKMISVSDDLSYREVADQEDRVLEDGAKVMDYAS